MQRQARSSSRQQSRLLGAADTKAALIAQGGNPDPGAPEEFARLIKEELVRNARITKAAGMKPE